MSLAAGTRLGPYEILSPLGAGGMGEVYQARDTRLGRDVAIKVSAEHFSDRFEREARSIALLNHPNICQLYDVGPNYLIMEFVEGHPPTGPMPAEDAVRLAIQIAAALEEAHSKRILHRDLKPANILITPKGTVKLLDFGLAKPMSADPDVTKSLDGTLIGTAAYMSPEQAQGMPLDERSDIFSFGAVLYELLSGDRAFAGDTMVEILSAVLRDDPRPLRAHAGLETIVKRCLAKNPADRFASASELRAALEQYPAKPREGKPSIAVLPFANMSLDKEQEFFSDGLAEEVLNLLAKIPELKVIARTSSFAFRGKEQDIRKIADALDVKTILEGSVRRSGNRIRVTAQLIDAQNGAHLWSERYDRELTGVFEVQDEIAAAISFALQEKLGAKLASKPFAPERYKPSLPAYEAYLKGRYHGGRMTADSLSRAQECFEDAVALDPQFALAHCELAVLYIALAMRGVQPPGQVIPVARSSAEKALASDPSASDAHAILGTIAAGWDYNWTEGGRRFNLALAEGSVSPRTRHLYGLYLLWLGRLEHAAEQYQQVVREDPLFLLYRFYLSRVLDAIGNAQDALRELNHVLDLDPNFPPAHIVLSGIYEKRGELTEALREIQTARSLLPLPETTGMFAGLLLRTGDADGARECMAKLPPPESYGVPRAHMTFSLYQGDLDKALDWYEKMIDQGDYYALIAHRIFGRMVHSSPRWPALAKRMNLPESAW